MNALDTEETTVLATYSARRNAEMARDYLTDVGIRVFVSSDDAGGMPPQMQRSSGAKLMGLCSTAQRARSLLDDAGLLPRGDDSQEAPALRADPIEESWASVVYRLVLLLGVLAMGAVLLMVVLG